ncbi:LytR family transcriptional regulator [Lysinibacillus sphaericus]|uniref:Regulatory protein MsrR n=2 Tax=Lysinibacillus TaxID=400634 RepID=A0A2S0K0K5_LYSSH|nr:MULTISPECIES: LCP family protein [Lysinibacillus]AVK96930.1 transcriptional regulator [Lysinibacillus sphaericus]MED4542204.1 LCP family protein [Lysinibacillus sphaericus]TKI20505.1 LytR family transcriptional regulator [Lysinibacillus sphaericus]TKI47303.1 LytR family transcriptional regulator [Lysinibacillus tabacifolii]UDK96871.1 LCP family protein [Lysinibacillus sphaericus]
MEEQDYTRRSQRPKKRRLRKGRALFTFLLLCVIVIAGYSIMQYRSGLQLATDTLVPQEDFSGDEVKDDIENYLLLGIDTRGEEKSRTDTMMVLSWNKKTNDVKLVSFMRDIYADIPGYQSYKLNTAYYLGGVQLLKDTLSNMFGLPIHHYALVDFKNFESLVDILAPNGVEMDVEKDMSEKIGVTLTKGTHNLNGQELLGYARFRHDAEGDFGRVARQQKVIEALKNELLAPQNLLNLPKFIGAAQGYVTTDYSSAGEIQQVLKMVSKGKVSIEKATIPIEGSYDFQNFSHAGSAIVIDEKANKDFLSKFLGISLE